MHLQGLAVTTMGNQVKRMSSLTDVAQACEPVVNQMTVGNISIWATVHLPLP